MPSTEATISSQSRLRAPPPDARPAVDVDAELPQKLERVAQAEGDPFQNRADERTAVVAQLEPDEGAARVGIGVRRPLTGEIGQEDQPLRARRPVVGAPRRASSNATPGASASWNHCSEPAAESITPIACQPPGTAWQNACTLASRSAR